MKPHIKHKARKFLWVITWTGLAAAFMSMILCFIWLVFPYKVAEVTQPIQIMNPDDTINVGDRIRVSITYKKYKAIAAKNFPVIECLSGNLVQMAPYDSNLPVGTGTFENDDFELSPKFTSGDKCQLILTQDYKVNPIRTVSIVSHSEFFTVTDTLRDQ